MWSPDGYHSWNDVLNRLFELSRQTLSIAVLGGAPVAEVNGKRQLTNTAEFYLKNSGFADSYDEAELIVAITTALLLVRFLEENPPILVNLNGSAVRADETIFCHKDQLECCYFDWPLKQQAEFKSFFQYSREGTFDTGALFDRFAFINGVTGEICLKNGAGFYLLNGLGLDAPYAKAAVSLAKSLSGFVVCWTDFPEGKELRDFLSLLEANEDFTRALNYEFGVPSDHALTSDPSAPKRRVGRPSKRGEAGQVYWTRFPNGHAAEGKSWKEAHRIVNRALKVPVSEDTLKRAVGEAQ